MWVSISWGNSLSYTKEDFKWDGHIQSQISTRQAYNAHWVTNSFALVILLVRFIFGQHYRKASFDITAVVILASIATVISRLVVSHFVLKYGTAADIILDGLSDSEDLNLDQIQTGSLLSLISRLIITTLYWLQCSLLLLFYTRILSHIRWVKVVSRMTWFVIGASYVAVVFATFLECRPLRLYWQIKPDPGQCIRAYVQLFVQCICNIVIDFLLLAISYSILNTQGREWTQKLQIALLYSLGTFCIIITCIRIAYIRSSDSAQPARSFWASIQGLISTFVANAPSIYGLLKLNHRKRTESSSRRRVGQADTYILMDEMSRRYSRRRGDYVEESDGNPMPQAGPINQGKLEQNSSRITETEFTDTEP